MSSTDEKAPDSNPAYERALTHAQAAYANAQDIIKFIDTKTSVVTGLATLATILPLLVFQWLAERDKESAFCLAGLFERSPLLFEASAWISLIGIGLGALGLVSALSSLRARALPEMRQMTLLFPSFDPKKSMVQARQMVARFGAGLTLSEVLSEYELQLLRVGQILHDKIILLSRAIVFFQLQVVVFILALAVAIAAFRF